MSTQTKIEETPTLLFIDDTLDTSKGLNQISLTTYASFLERAAEICETELQRSNKAGEGNALQKKKNKNK